MQEQTKNYANGILLKEHTFPDGNSELKVSINVESFLKSLQSMEQTNGWVNLKIKKMKAPSAKGHTHYMVEDTWKPKEKAVFTNAKIDPESYDYSTDDDQLPF